MRKTTKQRGLFYSSSPSSLHPTAAAAAIALTHSYKHGVDCTHDVRAKRPLRTTIPSPFFPSLHAKESLYSSASGAFHRRRFFSTNHLWLFSCPRSVGLRARRERRKLCRAGEVTRSPLPPPIRTAAYSSFSPVQHTQKFCGACSFFFFFPMPALLAPISWYSLSLQQARDYKARGKERKRIEFLQLLLSRHLGFRSWN